MNSESETHQSLDDAQNRLLLLGVGLGKGLAEARLREKQANQSRDTN